MSGRLGLLSDTHGDANITQLAVNTLVEQGATILIHLGDIGDENVIDSLAHKTDMHGKLTPEVHLVFGNTDTNLDNLQKYAEHLGMKVHHPAGKLTIYGKKILFHHGHDSKHLNHALNNDFHYFFQGHTHKPTDQQIDQLRVINPGALHRANQYSVATLDIKQNELEFIQIKK